MALRMACEASDYITSVVSIAGSTFDDPSSCRPATHPVSVLAVHGDMDDIILYEGGIRDGIAYPGAQETTERFARLAGCNTGKPLPGGQVDVLGKIDGAETTVLAYPDCADGTRVELWTMVGGRHIPWPWVDNAIDASVDWVITQPQTR